jgi:Spy/CpxP family protein refolding chaperone
MRMILTGIATLAVAGAGVVAMARPAGPRHGEGPNPAVLKQELGLSDEQSAQLQKLRQEERKQAIRQRADMEIARMELDQALDAATVDEKAVAAKVQALTQLQAAAVQARVDQRLAVRKLLSPEQRDKMRQLTREHRGRDRGRDRGRQGRFGAGPAGRPPTPTGPAVLEQGER